MNTKRAIRIEIRLLFCFLENSTRFDFLTNRAFRLNFSLTFYLFDRSGVHQQLNNLALFGISGKNALFYL